MQEERMISYRKKRKDEYIYRGTKERKKEKEDVKAMPVTVDPPSGNVCPHTCIE